MSITIGSGTVIGYGPNVGNITVGVPAPPIPPYTIQYLVVAGGGAGGWGGAYLTNNYSVQGGGGGGGGVRTGCLTVTGGTPYPITVGGGGVWCSLLLGEVVVMLSC